ncbi:MAG: alpha/beta hydrolase [Cyanobacteriota bacterium]|nr:alpha/beta hydrolase [Cyanobacteriota bacterium]
MQHGEGTFSGAGGLKLYYQSWYPPQDCQPRATIVIVHGLGAHSGVFETIVCHLAARGYALYALDLRGNGRSPGQRGYINNWQEFRDDLTAFVAFVTAKEPSVPLFLVGHSLGGLAALDWSLYGEGETRGLIALSPTLGKVGVSPLRRAIARLLSRVWPRFTLDTGIDRSASSRDPAFIAESQGDPLRHARASARLATEFADALARVKARATDLKVPLLILHGSGDRVALPEGSRCFIEQVAAPDKELREYPEAYHEMHNDLNCREVLSDLERWLEAHLP